MRAEFNIFDKDGDGSITEGELVAVFRRGGTSEEDARKEASQIMRHFDVNRDGQLQIEEFARWWEERTGASLSQDTTKQDWLHMLAGMRADVADAADASAAMLRYDSFRPELLRYCYRVAGTVGEMLLPVLGLDGDEADATP